jgi:hypothetical protein
MRPSESYTVQPRPLSTSDFNHRVNTFLFSLLHTVPGDDEHNNNGEECTLAI